MMDGKTSNTKSNNVGNSSKKSSGKKKTVVDEVATEKNDTTIN